MEGRKVALVNRNIRRFNKSRVYFILFYNLARMILQQSLTIFYFIPSSEFNAYLQQIKVILSAVKKYRIVSLLTNTIYIFSL